MGDIAAALWVFVLGGFGWLVASFVGRPILRFSELRGEVIHRMVLYGNVPAQWKERPDDTLEKVELSEDDAARLAEAKQFFRDLAARMRAFALNEPFAVRIVGFRYDAMRASAALIGLSNTIDKFGRNRAEKKWKAVEEALKFRSVV